MNRPPRIPRALLLRALPPGPREFVVGDLDEEYARGRSRLWYWSQALRTIAHVPRQEASMIAPSRPSLRSLATFPGDARIAARALARSPGYTAAALLTLGLGIGASIAIFSAVNEVMLRPLGFADPERLAMLWESNEERDWHQVHAAPANVEDWRARVTSFADVGFLSDFTSAVSLGGGQEATQVTVAQVSGNLFDVLGAVPMLGRTFREHETFETGRVVLSHALWQQQFGADTGIVGRAIRLDGRAHEVIGVMRPDFRYEITEAEAWTTMPFLGPRRGTTWYRRAHLVRPIARLKPGVTFAQAEAELAAVVLDLEREYPDTNTHMHQLQHQAARDRMFNRENADRLQRLQVAYEAETQQRQIELLRQEASLRSAELARVRTTRTALAVTAVLVLVSLALLYARYRLKQHSEARLRAQAQALSEALERVDLLKGMLPICAWCKQVRDDNGYWMQVEAYVSDHSAAEFTHSICPSCADRIGSAEPVPAPS